MHIPIQSIGVYRMVGHVAPQRGSVIFAQGSLPRGVRAASRATTPGRRALGFTCSGGACACEGDADCNDLFTTNLCGPLAICIDNRCYCLRN